MNLRTFITLQLLLGVLACGTVSNQKADRQRTVTDSCRVVWHSKLDSSSYGSGAYSDFETAKSWVDYANTKYPEIEHWLDCKTDSTTSEGK